jgi:hypothetical protein
MALIPKTEVTQGENWEEHINYKVGNKVIHDNSYWTNTTGNNSEPSDSSPDWLFIGSVSVISSVIAGNGLTETNGVINIGGASPINADIEFDMGPLRLFRITGDSNVPAEDKTIVLSPTQVALTFEDRSLILQSSGFRFIDSNNAPAVGDIWTANNVDGRGYWETPDIQTTSVTIVDPVFTNGFTVQILPAPGVNMVYDIISVSVGANVTTVWNGDITSNFEIGTEGIGNPNILILSDLGRFFRKYIVNFDYDGTVSGTDQIINQPLTWRSVTDSSGGAGTITFYATYRIIDLN